MNHFVILLLLTLSISSLSFAYGGVSTDRTVYPIPDIDLLELWGMNDVIIDGTVIDKEFLPDENGKEIFGYNIKVNEYFKGKQNAKIIYVKQIHAFLNFHLEKDDNALFYIKNTSEFGYVIQSHSVKTFGDCDARNLIEISQLPNGEYFRSSPTKSESYFDPCVANYFSYDPDFFKGIVNGITPLKQILFGIPIEKIRCFDNLVLIQKHDGTPACVKEQSIPRLMEQNWIKDNTKQQCETFSGIWNEDFATCFDFSDDYNCENMGGKLEGRAYTSEQPDYSKKSDSFVCEFRK